MKRMKPGGSILLLKLTKLTNRYKNTAIKTANQIFLVNKL
jgi:hypothetical protein